VLAVHGPSSALVSLVQAFTSVPHHDWSIAHGLFAWPSPLPSTISCSTSAHHKSRDMLHTLMPWLVSAAKRKLRSPPWQSLITHMSTYQPCIRNPPLMSALSTPTQRDESEAKEKVWKSSKWQKPRTIKRQSHLKWALSVPKDMGNYSTQLSSIASPQEEAERSQLH
jgi:hypothetical protein